MSGFLNSHSLASNPSLRFSLPISPDETFKAVQNDNIKNQEWQPTYYQNPGGIFSRLFNLWSWNYKNNWQLTLRQALFFEKTRFSSPNYVGRCFHLPEIALYSEIQSWCQAGHQAPPSTLVPWAPTPHQAHWWHHVPR